MSENLSTQHNMIPIVFFGRLEERKGLCTFIEGIKLLKPELKSQLKITFMGKIVSLYSADLKHLNSEQYIKQELQNDFSYEIIGNFYSQQAIEYIIALPNPIVCLCSPQENFPNTALEMGQLPVSLVVSDTGGFRETLHLVQREEGLYWFKPKDSDSFSEMLESAIAHYPEKPKVISKTALEEVNEKLLQQKVSYIEKAFAEATLPKKPEGKVTIGVICHHGGENLINCLGSLENQTYKNIDVIVVNDGAKEEFTQESFNHAKSLFPEYQFIHNEKTKGEGNQRNQLVEMTDSDYFLFFNPDVNLFPFAVEKFLETAENAKADIVTSAQKEIGVVNRIISYKGGNLPTLMMGNDYCGECCLFSRSLIEKFKFTESKEITTFNWEVIAAALVTGQKMIYFPYPLYEYIVKEDIPAYERQPSPKEKYSLRQYLSQIPVTQWTSRQLYMLITAVQQLQECAQQVAWLQWQLQQKTSQSSPDNNQLWELSQTHRREIESLQQQSEEATKNYQGEIESLRRQLEEAKIRIEAMETSKFWKLRGKWFNFKRKVGLPDNE